MSVAVTQAQLEQSLRASIENLNLPQTENFCTSLATRYEDCDAEAMTMTCSFPCEGWGANRIGRVHGGVVAAMLDQAMGLLCFAVTGRVPPTVEMQISYLRPAELQGQLYVKSRAVSTGKTFWHVNCEAWMEDSPERLVATASGVYFAAEYKVPSSLREQA